MRGAGAALLAVAALCTVSAPGASARPDCNACFMRNTGRDKAPVSNSTVRSGQERVKNEATVSERVVRSKRTAAAWGAAGAGGAQQARDRDSLHEVLRDVLRAQSAQNAAERMRERERERAAAGAADADADADAVDQWWEDSAADVGGAPEDRDRPQGGDWGDFRQQDIPSYFQLQTGFGRPLQVAA